MNRFQVFSGPYFFQTQVKVLINLDLDKLRMHVILKIITNRKHLPLTSIDLKNGMRKVIKKARKEKEI